MKNTRPIFFAVLCFVIFTPELFSQTDKEQILAIRNASNLALKSYENEEVLSYLTDDVLITTENYSAMWTKESGIWKIKSQLFVTLAEK